MMKRNKNDSLMAKAGTLIGKGVVVDGNVSAPETIRLDGTLNGSCDCKANLIIGADGSVKGDINAQNVLVSGKVEGDIYATGKVELLATGKMMGNITAKSLVIDENASFDGICSMTAADAPASGNAKSNKPEQPEKAPKDADNKSGKR